jgi:Methyltransferase domain
MILKILINQVTTDIIRIMRPSIAEEVNKLLKLQNEGKISESEFAQMIRELTKRNRSYFKEDILGLLKELWYQSYYVMPNMEDEFRLEVALKLLNITENIHMSTAEKQFELYKKAEKLYGIHILYAHFYSALPILSQLPQDIWDKRHGAGIDWNEKAGMSLMQELSKYYGEYERILDSHEFDDSGQYGWLDAALYYCMIRNFKPKHIIEVGAGDSTKLASLAACKNGVVDLESIDPFASENLSEISKLIKKPVQEIPISQFKVLQRNDILFIDSTHVCKIGSDVNYLFLDVLPNLNPGVLVHIHDIALPLEFPENWVIGLHRFWNEQYLLHAFLIGNCDFEVLFGIQYMLLYHRDVMVKLYGLKRLGGLSFWIRKIK